MTTMHLDMLSKVADPEGSTRFENVHIVLEQIPADFDDTMFYNDIEKNNNLIVEDYGTEYEEYEAHMFIGTVVIEKNGNYSWWRRLYN